MTTHHSPLTTHQNWLHRWAVLTVCATLVLLALGAVVTTFRVGMADPVWPTYPWHLLLVSWQEPQPGFLIEHAHRLAGYVVGCCVIVLMVGLWRCEPRRWLRWLGVAALAGVIVQGLVGGFRVNLHAWVGTDLAVIHGSFAHVVFALLAGIALLTARGGMSVSDAAGVSPDMVRLRRWSLLTTGLVFLQVVFGALLRHTGSTWGQRGHLLLAFAVVVAATWMMKTAWDQRGVEKQLSKPVMLLAALVTVQLVLGMESWLMRSSSGWLADLQPLTVRHALVRTAHVLAGALTLATAVVVTLQAHRQATPAVCRAVTPLDQRGEAA